MVAYELNLSRAVSYQGDIHVTDSGEGILKNYCSTVLIIGRITIQVN
jgi:hypothetical protein